MMSKSKLLLLAFLLQSLYLSAEFDPASFWAQQMNDKPHHELSEASSRQFFKQWFLGPLLVPSPGSPPPSTPVAEPSVTGTCNYGSYKNNWNIGTAQDTVWSVLYNGYWQFGLTQRIGIDIIANIISNYSNRGSYTHFTDTTLRLGYRISMDKKKKGDWTPNSRIMYQQVLPTGKYQNLRPSRNRLDVTGEGSWQSGFYIAIEKGFNFDTNHAFNIYGAFGCSFPTRFTVNRFNLYGGNGLTHGKVRAGTVINAYLSGEVELSRRISMAFDSNYQQTLSGSFSGNQGIGAPTTIPQTVIFSLAFPEIEIALSEDAGFVLGPWYSLGGQNAPAFASFFIAFLWTY